MVGDDKILMIIDQKYLILFNSESFFKLFIMMHPVFGLILSMQTYNRVEPVSKDTCLLLQDGP